MKPRSREAQELALSADVVRKGFRADDANGLAMLRRMVHRQRVLRARRYPVPTSLKPQEAAYHGALLGILAKAHEAFAKAWPALVSASRSRHDTGVRLDDWTDEVNRIFARLRLIEDLAAAEGDHAARTAAAQVDFQNRLNFLRTMRAAIGVDVFANAPQTAASGALFVQENVSLIKSIPTRYFSEVEGIVLRNFRAGVRAEDFEDDLVERYGVAQSRAALIARDQVSKLNGALTQNRQEALGIEAYFWRTSQDERVRPSHAELEGQRILWSDPPEVGHPGEDFQCRCHADPDVSEIFDE